MLMTRPADTIVTHAKVATINSAVPFCEAVAISYCRIVAVGSAADVAAFAGPDTEIIDAGGRT
ncbi:amidohydrolase, partial [Escherichia coli]